MYTGKSLQDVSGITEERFNALVDKVLAGLNELTTPNLSRGNLARLIIAATDDTNEQNALAMDVCRNGVDMNDIVVANYEKSHPGEEAPDPDGEAFSDVITVSIDRFQEITNSFFDKVYSQQRQSITPGDLLEIINEITEVPEERLAMCCVTGERTLSIIDRVEMMYFIAHLDDLLESDDDDEDKEVEHHIEEGGSQEENL